MANYDDIIESAARTNNIDPALIRAVIQTESSGNPRAVSSKGAVGLGQLMPATAKSLGVSDPTDPKQAIPAIAALLNENLTRYGNVQDALRAYHGGTDQKNWGPLTQAYPQKVLSNIGRGQPAAVQTLPGIPQRSQGADASNLSDEEILNAFPEAGQQQAKGRQATSQGTSPGSLTDEQILAAFPEASGATSQRSGAPKLVAQQQPQPGALKSFFAGVGKGIGSTVQGAEQLIGHGLQALKDVGPTPSMLGIASTLGGLMFGERPETFLHKAGASMVADANKGISNLNTQIAPYSQAHPVATTAGNISGSVAATLPLTMAAPIANTYRGAAGIGALTGAASGAATPVEGGNDFWGDKAQQVGLGALTGGVASPVLRGLSRLISPQVSPDVKALMDRGVTPTPGQILGGGFARTEEKLSSVPYLGDMIKNAQQRAVQQFNAAAYNEALAPIGEKFTGKVGQEGIEQVANKISAAYNEVLPKMQFKIDPQFHADVMNLSSMAQALPKQQADQFEKILKTQIYNKLGPQQNMDGQALKGVQSELAKAAKGYLGDPSYDQRQLGAAISALKDAVEGNLARVNSPDLVQKLANANQAWANFARIRAAGASQGAMNKEGVFTAAQLQNAVRSADKSVGKGATATGNALMQDLSGAGQSVLGSKYPDSGTAGRGLMSLLTLGGAGAGFATNPTPTLLTLGAIGAGSLPYTQLGQRAAAKVLTSRPQLAQPVGKAISKLGPVVVPGALPALLSGGQ
jgi:hypothetical protein